MTLIKVAFLAAIVATLLLFFSPPPGELMRMLPQ